MKRILFAEDDAFIRDLTSEKLAQAGFDVAICESGDEALAKLDEGEVDLLLLDLELKGTQGTDVLEQMSKTGQIDSVPVIVFSNNDEPEMREKCHALGATAFFVKVDTDLNELITKVSEVLTAK